MKSTTLGVFLLDVVFSIITNDFPGATKLIFINSDPKSIPLGLNWRGYL